MLQGSRTMFRAGSFEFTTRHLLVIAVLALAFSAAVIMRSYPIKYGFYLNEFDPFFDYRATQFILDNGLEAYWQWHDTMSWYPEGRDIAATSQSGLHVTAAVMYQIFGAGAPLMDFTIMFPVIIGSLTVIVIFALVRVLAGTTAGLYASLLFAFTPPIILRGNLGWFKSEPLGLFFGLIAAYLFISAIRHKEIKYAIPKAIVGGLLLGLANASWGGIQYFSIPIALFFLALPFFRRDLTIPMYVAIAFTVFTLIATLGFPRPGMSFVAGLPGIAMVGTTIYLVAANFLGRLGDDKVRTRNLSFLLIAFVAAGIGLIAAGIYAPPSFRYVNAVNPFVSSENPLVESVAEHLTPTIVDYFLDYSVLLMFAGLGAWLSFQKRNDSAIFALILGITALYVSATFARLLVFASVGIIVLASIGLFEITRNMMERKEASVSTKSKKKPEAVVVKTSGTKIAYVATIIAILLVPMFYPPQSSWITAVDVPTAIANGGSVFRIQTDDWVEAMEWISENTEEDAVIAAWWDYGYWITTLGERTTIADNATINSTRIETIASMFIGNPETGAQIAQDLDVDYILVYVVAQKALTGTAGDESGREVPLYMLGQGGDESKKHWIMRIGGYDERRFVETDGWTGNNLFCSSTLLGRLMPYEPVSYVMFGPDGDPINVSETYQPGFTEMTSRHIKYPADGGDGQPFHWVYSSSSYQEDRNIVTGVHIYKVNRDYEPRPMADTTPGPEVAEIETTQGTIKLEFFPNTAPGHVSNFIALANDGFYDGQLFHRLLPGFVIQAGDPQTADETVDRSLWGQGGPGFTISAEFNDIPHTRGILSMARTAHPDSAGSQFFIMVGDAPFLDNQYTVFGRVIEGMDVVDRIVALEKVGGTGPDRDQPANPEEAKIISVRIVPR